MGSKLNIQPMTMERLRSTKAQYSTPNAMRNNLQTGDIVVIKTPSNPKLIGVYVSFEDMSKFKYDIMTNLLGYSHAKTKSKTQGSIIIDEFLEKGRLSWYGLSFYDSKLETIETRIIEVRRRNDTVQPLDVEYFKNPPLKGSYVVWKRE